MIEAELLSALQSQVWWCDYISSRYSFGKNTSKGLDGNIWYEGTVQQSSSIQELQYRLYTKENFNGVYLRIETNTGFIVLGYEGIVPQDGSLVFTGDPFGSIVFASLRDKKL